MESSVNIKDIFESVEFEGGGCLLCEYYNIIVKLLLYFIIALITVWVHLSHTVLMQFVESAKMGRVSMDRWMDKWKDKLKRSTTFY